MGRRGGAHRNTVESMKGGSTKSVAGFPLHLLRLGNLVYGIWERSEQNRNRIKSECLVWSVGDPLLLSCLALSGTITFEGGMKNLRKNPTGKTRSGAPHIPTMVACKSLMRGRGSLIAGQKSRPPCYLSYSSEVVPLQKKGN